MLGEHAAMRWMIEIVVRYEMISWRVERVQLQVLNRENVLDGARQVQRGRRGWSLQYRVFRVHEVLVRTNEAERSCLGVCDEGGESVVFEDTLGSRIQSRARLAVCSSVLARCFLFAEKAGRGTGSRM